MSRTPLTIPQVLALSPDDASSKAAKGLTSPNKWVSMGATDEVVWGECQGSGSKPYQTQVDVSEGGTTFKCSCPSRKFPCKHGLALLLVQAQDPSRFSATQPAWVTEWLNSRRQRAEKKEAKVAAVVAAKEAQAADPVAAAKAAEKEQKKEQQRWQQMQAGAQELGLWLNDLLRQGLASLSAGDQSGRQADNMAARMVDAKAAGLGQRLTQAMARVGEGKDWPAHLLAELGSLQLLIDALGRIQDLPPEVQAEVRQAAGWPIDKESVLTSGETVEDVWQVLGVMTLERDSGQQRLTERRVWLQGERSKRLALLLDFAFAGQGLTQTWHTQQCLQATMRFYPGLAPVRAVVASALQAVDRPVVHAPAPTATAHDLAVRMSANPWSPSWPVLWDRVQLLPPHDGQRLWALSTIPSTETPQAQIVPLALGETDAWQWLAQTDAQALTVFGEWDGQHLHPYTAWSSTGQWIASQWVDVPFSAHAGSRPVADEALLLQAALVGSNQPLSLSPPAKPTDAVAVLLRQVDQQAMHTPTTPNGSGSGNHLLRLAGALAWCKRAGHVAPPRPSEAKGMAEPPAEHRAVAPLVWANVLQQALSLDKPRLQAEVLQAMNDRQWRVPIDLLSVLLNLGRQTAAMRALIQPVLGERGRWLGGINRDWAWAQGVQEHADIDTVWAHGSLEQRLNVLHAERRSDPKAARERLMASWSSLPAKERHALLDTFRVGLNAEDEAFLDLQLQKDRGADVRRLSADLLAALPHSAYAQRMALRLAPLVRVDKKKLWVEAPPEPLIVTDAKGQPVGTHPSHLPSEAELKTDWPDAERGPYERLGPRAWLLFQWVRRSSLSWWTAHTGLSPAELIQQAKHSDWTEALLRGWLHACTYQPDPDWLLALLRHGKTKQWGNVEELLLHLSPEQRDQYQLGEWSADMADTDQKKRLQQANNLQTFLNKGLTHLSPHAQWSERLSAYIARVLHTAIQEKIIFKELDSYWNHRDVVIDAACALHPSHLSVFQALAVHMDDQPANVNDALRTIHHIVALRLNLHQQLAAHP